MRALVVKSNFKTNYVLNVEIKVLILKVLLLNKIFTNDINKKLILKLKLLKYNKLNNINKLKKRCLITSYPKNYSFFNMSRMMIKSLMSKGFLIGVRKSSW
jgi:ribosomal protein S14